MAWIDRRSNVCSSGCGRVLPAQSVASSGCNQLWVNNRQCTRAAYNPTLTRLKVSLPRYRAQHRAPNSFLRPVAVTARLRLQPVCWSALTRTSHRNPLDVSRAAVDVDGMNIHAGVTGTVLKRKKSILRHALLVKKGSRVVIRYNTLTACYCLFANTISTAILSCQRLPGITVTGCTVTRYHKA